MTSHQHICRFLAVFIACALIASVAFSQQQQISSFDRERAENMLRLVASDVRKNYYDPKMHGVDWDAKVAETKQKIEHAPSLNMALSNIAALLDSLDDSHTFFLPPSHAYWHDYGWQYQMIGTRCYVIRVRPKSDAETKGIKPGDEVLAINGYTPDRGNLWKMEYVYNILRPQSGLHLKLQSPSGEQRELDAMAKMREHKRITDVSGVAGGDIWNVIRDQEDADHLMRARFMEISDDLMILKLPGFFYTESEVEKIIDKARKHKALIVDLRGNLGGSVDTLRFLASGVFEKDVKLCDRVGKKDNKPTLVKASRHPFTGKLVVLVDSRSASASEVFARVVQLEKRGVVIGDVSSGSVMESRHFEESSGTDTLVFYGASVTEADLIMSDGKSLEHKGVIPDETVLPTGEDLAAGRDPVLARAADVLGVKLSTENAGKLFPYEWTLEK